MLRVEAEDRSDHDEYFSPSDIYRAVLRNNAAKRDQQSSHGVFSSLFPNSKIQ